MDGFEQFDAGLTPQQAQGSDFPGGKLFLIAEVCGAIDADVDVDDILVSKGFQLKHLHLCPEIAQNGINLIDWLLGDKFPFLLQQGWQVGLGQVSVPILTQRFRMLYPWDHQQL